MELISEKGPFPRCVAGSRGDWTFTLIDVGCSGGIDPAWRALGERLQAIGFDPSIQEVERLRGLETSPRIVYEAIFVGPNPDAPITYKPGGLAYVTYTPWPRLAVARTMVIMAQHIRAVSDVEKLETNSWRETQLASEYIQIPEYLHRRGIGSVDFVKIDIDGPDFEVLQTLSAMLDTHQVLGLGLEVNYIGSDDPTDHTFHNTDRWMRKHGFALFGLTVRPYSVAASPHRYRYRAPNVSIAGRPFQGDAVYLRDLCAPEQRARAGQYAPEKLLKLAALFSLTGLPDHAAEVLLTFREQLSPMLDIDHALDLLASETVIGRERGWTYRELMEAFERNDPAFYPPP